PVYIGKNVEIENSIIGPYATINDGCIIKNSIIDNSIIENSSLIENCVMSESIIGEGASVKREILKLNIGNYSEI
ncbi:MAG: nucleotidyl transferase, partial [Ignavibacteria bacterium]